MGLMIKNTSTYNNKLDYALRSQIISLLREVFSEPDFGLELKPSFVKKLKKSINNKKKGDYQSLDKIIKKYRRQ